MKTETTQFVTLWKKEFRSLALSPGTCCAVLLLLLGAGIPYLFPSVPLNAAVFSFRQYLVLFPFLSAAVFPALTMTTWSDEYKKGTYRILLSLPVHDWILVLGKYATLLSVYIAMLLLTVPVLFLSPAASFDIGILVSSYLFLFLFGCSALALGQFCSAFFSSSVLSFLVTSIVLILLNFCQLIPLIAPLPDWAAFICTRLSFAWHFESSARGIIDSRDILFYLLPAVAALQANRMYVLHRRSNP